MESLKEKIDNLCIQFFDDGEDKVSLESVRLLKNAGYKVEYSLTSGASALMVNGYEVIGSAAISRLAKQILKEGEK